MPVYDFYCPQCGKEEHDMLIPFTELEEKRPVCIHGEPPTPVKMEILIGKTSFECIGKDWPDKDHKELKERFIKRNKRIEKMTPEQQNAFKRIIDSTGGKRYIP